MIEDQIHQPMWMISGGPGGQLSSEFVSQGVIALSGSISASGKDKVGDLGALLTLDQFNGKLDQVLGDYAPIRRAELAKILHRFCHEIHIGDYVLTYNPNDGFFALGTVIGGYEYNLGLIIDRPHTRAIYFSDEKFSRHDHSFGTIEALKKIRNVYQIQKEAAEEILLNFGSTLEHVELEVSASSATKNNGDLELQIEPLPQSNRSSELIKDQICSLVQGDLEKLVYGLLRAMGYMIRVPQNVPSNCIDTLATSDGLGFKMTTIAVAVKHDNNGVDVSGVRTFMSDCKRYEGGLYVSTGGFTNDAQLLAQMSGEPITLMDLDMLLRHLRDYYDKLDNTSQSLFPIGTLS